MTKVDLLDSLQTFTQFAVKDLFLPVKIQRGDETEQYRNAHVYKMRLPDSSSATKKVPYIIHQVITGKDSQKEGGMPDSSAVVRSIFCVYSDDEQEGAMMLLELMERLRIELLRRIVIGEQFMLDLKKGMEVLIYPDDTAPYFAGEMISNWTFPSVEREVVL